MSLFQTSVLKKYLQGLDRPTVDAAFDRFATYFHNPAIQENIKNAKEEQFQEGFLRELFVNVFGYILNPNPDYNLTTEFKNLKGSKKADGAILRDGKAVAVVELKGMDTTDLDKIEAQAFGYKSNQPGCQYVVTSNYEKLRFYIDNTVDFEEFHLFSLTKERFDLLWLCLSQENVFNALPKRIKEDSVVVEEDITKKLYKDYSAFKSDIFHSIVEKNKQYDKLLLFKKTQKLLDRFLFIFFAEDRLLLPPNSIRMIIDQWVKLRDELDAYTPLYDRFKKYFGYMNTGHKGKLHEIFAYNGGLFEPDEILDNIKIADDLLYKHTLNLSHYDFESEVDVNILGHIFEHSLNEIEEITAELEGQPIDKSKTKRKKDGVFYTPKYITKYIVENTVGKLCEEKKAELQIIEEEYHKDRNRRRGKTLIALDNRLNEYRKWLLELTICDPACGSGAFLNQALEFFINEHHYVDELNAKLFEREGENLIVFRDVAADILEKNLYGVDINEESVEIAKLSLWLRTAQKGRKLSVLSNNIKCGNSLIDEPAIAGGKAFNWEKEFPHVFEKGGFDVVIGNPPYVFGGNKGITIAEKAFFAKRYITGVGKVNLFTLFIEKGIKILKDDCRISFIIPNTFLRVTSYDDSRRYFLTQLKVEYILDAGVDVFDGAITSAIIFIGQKSHIDENHKVLIQKGIDNKVTEITQKTFIEQGFVISININHSDQSLLKKLLKDSIMLGSICKELIFGVVITKNKDEVLSENQIEGWKPFLEGKDITSYHIRKVRYYLNYDPHLLHRARTTEVFETEKLLIQRITGGNRPLKVAYDEMGYYTKESINNLILPIDSKYRIKYILTLLNSKLINWYYCNIFTNESTLTVNISKEYLSKIPIKDIPEGKQRIFESKANLIINSINELENLSSQFTRLLTRRFSIEKLSQKLENLHTLTYTELLQELKKQKIKLSLSEEAEWEEYFEAEKAKVQAIQQQIDETDMEIDRMVYELYGLTEEEIGIVENNS